MTVYDAYMSKTFKRNLIRNIAVTLVITSLLLTPELVSAAPKLTLTAPTASQSVVYLTKGTALSLTARYRAQGDKVQMYSSSNSKVAKINVRGKVKAVKTGKATITVRTAKGKKDTIRLVVTSKKKNAKKITITKSKSVNVKVVYRPTVKLTPKSATNTVRYKSSNKKIATVNAAGYITAKKVGKVTITAKTSNGKVAKLSLTVKDPVKISKTKATVRADRKLQLTASAPSGKLKWSSSDKSIATVNSKGEVTAKKDGTVKIIATTTANKTSSSCTVTVVPHIKSTAIALSPASGAVYAGSTLTLTPALTSAVPGQKSNDEITWSSSDDAIATVTTGGTVTGVSYGTAIITAKSESGDKANAEINVKTIKASHSSERLIGGVVYYAKFKTYGTKSTPLTYSTSDKKIATVNASTGKVQVNRGAKASDAIKTGTVTITATTPEGEKATMKLKVVDEPVIADISKWQGNIDWSQAKRTIDLAILRVCYGARTMAEVEKYEFKYPSYSNSCIDEDIPYGVYDYVLYKTKAQAEKEATIFYKAATADGRRPLFFVVDAEESFLTWANTKAFIAKLRSLAKKDYDGRVRVGLYIGQYYYKSWKLKAPLQDLDDSKTPDFVWIPRYGTGNTGTINSSTLPDQPCDMWQFTSSAYIPGISGKVDVSTLFDVNGKKLSKYSKFNIDWLTEGGPATSIVK
jgi:uncharacterized protein YjdB